MKINRDNSEQELWDLLRAGGHIPGSDEEVEVTEMLLSEQPPGIPLVMEDGEALLRRMESAQKVVELNTKSLTLTEESLARAARDGKEISKEAEDLMRKDRAEAETNGDGL